MSKKSEPSSQTGRPDSAYKSYLAAGFGAFCLGFGDLLTNAEAATVLKIAQVLRQYFGIGAESGLGGIVPLLFIVVMGVMACWVYSPESRFDAFMRGFSVFAILAVVTPYKVLTGDEGQVSEISTGAVFHTDAPRMLLVQDAQPGTATIHINSPVVASGEALRLHIVVRDAESVRVVADQLVTGRAFSIEQKSGYYMVEVEAPGHRRVMFNLVITDQDKSYELRLETSKMPLGIQRLFAPKPATLKELL